MTRAIALLRGLGLAAIAIAMLAGCGSAVGPTLMPSAAPASLSSSASPVPTAGASPSTPVADPTLSASEAPTPQPTATPAPRPSPTLNWAANGCSASVKDPVNLGSKETVELRCPVGPTCSIKVKYPSGASATLPAATHPKPGAWLWTWTIPKAAGAGHATGTATCTYAGVPHAGSIDFKIVDPTPPHWSISVTYPATYNFTTDQWLKIKIAIVGTYPVDPDHTPQKIVCSNQLSTLGGVFGDTLLFDWNPGDPPLDWWLQPGLFANSIGAATWQVQCRSYYISPNDWRTDSGTVEIAG